MPWFNWTRPIFILLFLLPILGAEDLLQPLNLERVVIKGEARRNPAEVSGPWREEVEPVSSSVRVREGRSSLQPSFRFKSHGRVQYGSDEHWSGSHSLFLLGDKSSLGYLSSFVDEDGFRKGYRRQDQDLRLEGEVRSFKGLDLKASFWHQRRDLDLPEPTTLADVNDHRKEEAVGISTSLEGTISDGGSYKWLFDFEDAQQSNSVQSDYRYRIVRAGGVLKAHRYETAFSLEWERKGQEQTTLMRTFVKGERRSLDERTSFHAGLGVYFLSSKESAVDKSGALSIIEKDKNTSVAFSPYLRLDHQLRDNLAFFASTTRFYQSLSVPDNFFNNPLANVPPSVHQPSLNLSFESGLRLDLEQDWRMGLSLEWTKKRLAQVWVIDLPASNGRLNTQTFDRGRESQLNFSLRGPLTSGVEVEANYHYLWSKWDFPAIDFTPFAPESSFTLGVFIYQPTWRVHARFRNEHGIQTWPVVQRLTNRKDLNLGLEWVFREPLTLFWDISNALDHESEDSIAFPSAPWSTVIGFKADL